MRIERSLTTGWLALVLALAPAAVAGCGGAGEAGQAASAFESDLPASSSSKGAGRHGASGGVPASNDASESDDAGSAERAIVEADIVQVRGDRLYALSRVAGLTIIDLSNPAQLAVVGRYRELNGTPFEMYLRDGVVLAMYSAWGQYVKEADGRYSWVQTSKVIALDVANPAAVAPIGSFDVAGEVSDSRIVGDVMYVVGYQNGYCWGCTESRPQTAILSLDVKDPRRVRKVDELVFGDGNNTYGWNKRSVTVTAQRMYVAGPEYGSTAPAGSTIQVVDISDPAGDLVEGGTVVAAGQISSRWQMDEHDGVLRVISQIPPWWQQTNQRPMVQTFKVESAAKLTPLGSTPLTIPPREVLNTVRFDGPRGYAITSERSDPLFTIDLSDPANPRQLGELEMPGWIYHLVPRGNRLIGLGYDQGNPAGAITVSVFDVSNLAAPTLLDRVNFGGDWAWLPEDQDRIHKAFRILDDLQTIVVPFSGWTDTRREGYCRSAYGSGVQLVDLRGDDLILRGAAPARGEARRAIVHAERLLTVSDEAVDTFDLTDRDRPAPLGRLSIARNVSHALPLANGHVARINEDWYGRQNSTIDIVALAEVDRPERSVGEVDLSALVASGRGCHTYAWINHVFAQGNLLSLSYRRWEPAADLRASTQVSGVLTVDASDPAQPVVVSKLEQTSSELSAWGDFFAYYQYGYGVPQKSAVQAGSALVFLEQRYVPRSGTDYTYEQRMRVVDLSNPAQPTEAVLALPHADGYSGLVVDGTNVLITHFEETGSGRARFYLDRVDLSRPSAPAFSAKINVPGSLLHYDGARAQLVTSELVRVSADGLTAEACYARFAFADFESRDGALVGTCTGYRQQLHLVRLVEGSAERADTYALAERERLSSSSLGDGRVAAVISHGFQGWYLASDCYRCGYGDGGAREPAELLSLGFETGRFRAGRLRVDGVRDPWWGFWGAPAIHAAGTRALVQSQTDAVVLDLTDPAAPTLLRKVPLYGGVVDLAALNNLVVLALGMHGAQSIEL